jgi:hypothetical protein
VSSSATARRTPSQRAKTFLHDDPPTHALVDDLFYDDDEIRSRLSEGGVNVHHVHVTSGQANQSTRATGKIFFYSFFISNPISIIVWVARII